MYALFYEYPTKRLVTSMRKFMLILTTILCLFVLTSALADGETVVMDSICATVEIPDKYITITPANMSLHPEWLARMGADEADLKADWSERGVLLQAWSSEGDVCLEITAVQDDEAMQYFNIDEQTTKTRSVYRTSHLKNTRGDGWTYQSAEWKKTTQYGRFLMLKYKRTLNGEAIRGYARRTIRNGYTITLDYQVHGRSLKNADNTALNGIIKTWNFTQVLPKPVTAVSKLKFDSQPPAETNTGKFTIEGTCDPGLHIIAVAMRMSSPDPIVYETTATKKGKFEIDVALPSEGVWLMTLTVENGDVITEEIVFDTTTYQDDLLPVNLDVDCPVTLSEMDMHTFTGDKTVISGKTIRSVTVQCLVEGAVSYDKLVKTNNTGKFSFSVDTSAEGDYEITLVFSKKNYSTRRFTIKASRTLTDEQRRQQVRDEAVKPRYGTLNSKLEPYTGRIMGYTLYPQEIVQSGDEWIIFAAMTKTKSAYKDIVVVITKEEPPVTVAVNEPVKMYGECVGPYEVTSEEGTKEYPCFDLLFWD